MKIANILVVLVLLFIFVEVFECAGREQVIVKRRSAKSLQDQETSTRLETIALETNNQLKELNDKITKITTHLVGLDDKISKINDNAFYEKHNNDVALPITLLDEKTNELDRKLSQLINQTDKCFYDTKNSSDNGPIHLTLPENAQPYDLEIISQELKETFRNFGDVVKQIVSENGAKFDQISRHLRLITEEIKKKNYSGTDEVFMQIERKERRISDHTSLINEILSMVKNRLELKEEDDEKNMSELVSSLTNMVSSYENMKSSALVQNNKTTLRKDGIIFPNVKNKPAKINTTFTSEAFDIKDFKVGLISCVWRPLMIQCFV